MLWEGIGITYMVDVGCAGILVADTFCGPLQALPRPGQLVAAPPFHRRAGGCAANVAINLAKHRISVEIAGCLGQDAAGEMVLESLKASKVGCDRVTRSVSAPTSETTILLVAGEDRRFIHNFGANAHFSVEHVDLDWASRLKVFYLGGLCALPGLEVSALAALLAHCHERGVVTVIDVVIPQSFKDSARLGQVLQHADYFLPNDDEARAITGETVPREQLRALCRFGARNVIITRGEEGALAARGNETWELRAYPAQVVDPSGAGDAFASGIVSGIVRGWDMLRMLRYANVLGASATQALGTTDGVVDAATAERLAEDWLKQQGSAVAASQAKAWSP